MADHDGCAMSKQISTLVKWLPIRLPDACEARSPPLLTSETAGGRIRTGSRQAQRTSRNFGLVSGAGIEQAVNGRRRFPLGRCTHRLSAHLAFGFLGAASDIHRDAE
jgi:hypothetical protein